MTAQDREAAVHSRKAKRSAGRYASMLPAQGATYDSEARSHTLQRYAQGEIEAAHNRSSIMDCARERPQYILQSSCQGLYLPVNPGVPPCSYLLIFKQTICLGPETNSTQPEHF